LGIPCKTTQVCIFIQDGACDLGEAVLPTQGNENMTPKDEETENQKEEIQADEQKHEDKGGDFTMEPLVECKDVENGTNNRIEDTDVCEVNTTLGRIACVTFSVFFELETPKE
jgi:hypothetical protein